MDFTQPKEIGREIDRYDFVQLKNGNGYDHNFVLNTKGDLSTVAARLSSPESGIVLEVYTDEPGIQVYTGKLPRWNCEREKSHSSGKFLKIAD